MIMNVIRNVRANARDGHDRMNAPVLGRELKFDSSRRDDFNDFERPDPLVIQFFCRAIHCVVLEAEPYEIS